MTDPPLGDDDVLPSAGACLGRSKEDPFERQIPEAYEKFHIQNQASNTSLEL